ncbi:MAG: choice-of-anchor P family protein [Actinomycetota bacterium]
MRGTKRVALAMFIVATLVTSIMVVNSSAATVIGEFEIDGNLTDSAPGVPYDWDTLPGAVVFNDPDTGSGCAAGEDDIFGGSSDEEVPGEWLFDCGSAPQKDDFLEAGIGTRKIAGDTWLYLYFIRKFDGGSAVLNYEFNRSNDTFDNDGNPATPEVPVRTPGDLLFNLEVAGGGSQTTIQVFQWDGNHEVGNWVMIGSAPVKGTDWDVATNADPNDKLKRFTFAELALRLEAFGVTPSCPGLGKAWIKSNSTFDFENGVLKDRTVRKDVPLSNCGIKDWSFTLSPGGIAGVTVKAVYTVAGGETRSITLTDPEGDGTYTATDNQIPPGTVSFHFEVLNGDALIWASEEDSETFVEGERKTNEGALGFEIALTPDEAENFAGDPHVFTATVTNAATGEGLPNVPVNFALTNGTPEGCGSITPASGLTAADGTFTATVSSATPCTTDVVAWINGTQSGATTALDAGEANDVSSKAFVAYALSVSPPSATNEAGKEHTFNVLLTKDSGSGAEGLPGATVDLSIDAAEGSDAHFTSINGEAASGTEATCVTLEDDPQTAADEAGTCVVKIVATTPGDLTLNASYTAADSDGTTKVIEGHADKSFHAFDLSIDGGGQTNLAGQEHTFTVKLTRDTGDGPVGYPGQTLTLTLDQGASDAHFVSINGQPASGTEATCVTREDDPETPADEAGTCSVTITSSESGTATLSASWETELDSGTLTLTETATKQFSSFDIDIDGGDQTNEVGTEHTFTVTLTRDDGDGPVGYAGQSIALALNVGTTDAHFVSINGAPAAGTEAVCITAEDDPNTDANEAGTCVVVITASEPGTVTLTATWEGVVDSGPVVVTETVTKRFVDFDLTVTPPEAQNEIGQPHTFLVTLTKDEGDGPAGLAGETVDLSLDPGDSDAHFVAINGEPASGTEGSCVTQEDDPATTDVDEAGTCTVTITSSTAGTATLTASWETELDSGTVTREATATKSFFDFAIEVNPPTAFNRVGEPHTFTVLLTKDSGGGSIGFGGQTVELSLDAGATDAHFTSINGDPASGTEATCVTSVDDPETPADEGGICTVTITSSSAGSVTLTATWEDEVGGATVTRSDTAVKTYLAISLTKNACPATSSPAGGIVDYAIAFSIGGAPLTNATVVDELPDGVELVSASQIGGVTPTVSGGTITWTFPTLPAGSYTGSIQVRILETVANGTELTNTVTLDSDEISPEVATHTLTVSDEGRGGSSRAYGISLDLLGSELIGDTPDSDVTNPGEVLSIPDPFGSDTPLLKLLSVSESNDSTAEQESHSATASALNVDLNVPGVLHLKADTVVAKTTSQASATSAGSSRGGSLIQGLEINGIGYGAVSEPTTVLVRDPLSGDVLAEVHLLETTRTGAANGEAQPNGDADFASGIAVNGIHVKVHLLDLVDLIVSHSESAATFPSGIGCDGAIPAVSGSAYALGINLKPDSADGIDLGSVKVAQVNLPITGGEDSASLADVNVPGVVTAGVAGAATQGEITDGDDEDTVPVEATSEAHTANVNLLDGTIRARAVDVISHTEAGQEPTGKTEIAYLEIGGTDVCAAIGLDSICTPDPNTELLIPGGPILVVLNEQIPEPGGLTVNGVHIWVLGKGNPFGLPVGADIVISNAHSDAHPAESIVVDDSPAVINVKALSAPSAKKLGTIEVPKLYEVPVAVPLAPQIDVPVVSVPEILQDPVAVVEDLTDLALPEEILEDATQLVETLTNPEALLEALADPASLLEGLSDPVAALEALAEATGVVVEEEPAAAETQTELTPEQLTARLLRLVGL